CRSRAASTISTTTACTRTPTGARRSSSRASRPPSRPSPPRPDPVIPPRAILFRRYASGEAAMAVQSLRKGKTVRQQVSKEEWQKRVDLAAAYRLMDVYAMTEMSANHISTRVPGEEDAFLINPYGLLYDQMTASCFIKVDLAGDILFNPTELGINKAGYVIHSAIHEAR